MKWGVLAGWDGEKTKKYKAVAMCTPNVVVYVTDGHVDRPV
jgi:hypothetical protein